MNKDTISPLKKERQEKQTKKQQQRLKDINIDSIDYNWEDLKSLSEIHHGTLSAFAEVAMDYERFNQQIRAEVPKTYSLEDLNKVVNLHNKFVNDINSYTQKTIEQIKDHSFKFGAVLAEELPIYTQTHILLSGDFETLYNNLVNQQAALAEVYCKILGEDLNVK
jgi:abortive infection bacteriophage resistance protein